MWLCSFEEVQTLLASLAHERYGEPDGSDVTLSGPPLIRQHYNRYYGRCNHAIKMMLISSWSRSIDSCYSTSGQSNERCLTGRLRTSVWRTSLTTATLGKYSTSIYTLSFSYSYRFGDVLKLSDVLSSEMFPSEESSEAFVRDLLPDF